MNSGTDLNLVLATDLPFLKPSFLRYLIVTGQATDALVTVPRIGSHFEPLCAVYHKRLGELVEAAISRSKNKVDALFAETPTRTITEEEIVNAGFGPAMFRNLNSPDDLRQAQQQLP